MSKPNLSGHISDVQIGENCTDVSIGNNCSNITIGNNCKNVEIAANNSQINIGNDCSNIVIDESSVQADGILRVKPNVIGLTVSAEIVDDYITVTEDQKNLTIK